MSVWLWAFSSGLEDEGEAALRWLLPWPNFQSGLGFGPIRTWFEGVVAEGAIVDRCRAFGIIRKATKKRLLRESMAKTTSEFQNYVYLLVYICIRVKESQDSAVGGVRGVRCVAPHAISTWRCR